MIDEADLKPLRIAPDGTAPTTYTKAAGATDIVSSAIDTVDAEVVDILVGFGAIVAGGVQSVKISQCPTSGGTYADLATTSITVADTDDDKMTHHVVVRPTERFLKANIQRATQNSTIDFVLACMRGNRKLPFTKDSTVISREVTSGPTEGTA